MYLLSMIGKTNTSEIEITLEKEYHTTPNQNINISRAILNSLSFKEMWQSLHDHKVDMIEPEMQGFYKSGIHRDMQVTAKY